MPPTKAEIIEALLEAFDEPFKLRDFLDVHMGAQLAVISLAPNLRSMMTEVVRWCESSARLQEFLDKAAGVSQNPRVAQCAKNLAKGGGRGPVVIDTRSGVINELLTALDDRKDLFRFLNATKELHEIMHEVTRSRGRVLTAVHDRMNSPGQELADDVADSLQEWIEKARQSSQDTEFPERHQDWIKRMETCLAILTDSDPGRWEWAFERLDAIPAREMSRLNDRLVDYAAKLECDELVELSKAVEESLEGSESRKTKDAGLLVEQFRVRCGQLADLVFVHDECQKVEELLAESVGLSVITADSLMAWSEVAERLADLKERCEGNRRVACTFDAAEEFASAKDTTTAASNFATFREHFDDLFHNTDKDLLKASNRVGNLVFSMASQLEALL